MTGNYKIWWIFYESVWQMRQFNVTAACNVKISYGAYLYLKNPKVQKESEKSPHDFIKQNSSLDTVVH